MKNKNKNFGYGLVEVIIGAAIISISMIGMVSLFNKSFQVSRDVGKKARASFILNEGVEAVRIMRDLDWNNISSLSTSTEYHLIFSAGKWSTTTDSFLINGDFDRKFSVFDVYRDANDDISLTGSYDGGIKKIKVTVSWLNNGATTSQAVSTYFANIF